MSFLYWEIYLFEIIGVFLFVGIYKTAFDMQKKSEAKQRKMQSMVALSAGAMSGMAGRAAGIGLSKTPSSIKCEEKNDLPNAIREHEKTPLDKNTLNVAESYQGDSNSSQKTSSSVSNSNTTNTTTTTTASAVDKKNLLVTSGKQLVEADKSERSSSPAFESDEDSTAPVRNNNRYFHVQNNTKSTILLLAYILYDVIYIPFFKLD